MKIRSQLIITILLFGIILVSSAVSAIIVNQLTKKASEQEKIASSIAEGANELNYLANDYLIYREGQQLKRWQSRFASFSNQVARLNVNKPEHHAAIRNIQANQQRLKEVFDSVASNLGRPSQNQSVVLDPAFFQVSWGRMAVQSQGLISDASRLSQLLHQETDHLRGIRSVLIYVMVILFGLFLLASYMLTYRRILKSIMTLQAGTAVIGAGNLDFKIEEKKNDEIGDLSRAFNRMAANLKDVTASKSQLEREITERKKAEEELRQQREWLRVTLSSIGDAVIASDTEGRITFLNPVAVTLTGWESEEALNQPINNVFQIINEKTRQPAEDLVARVLGEKRVVGLANDTALVTRDGREVPIEDSAAPILDATGNVTGAVLVFHDVTAKRRAQAVLRESEERFRAVFESSSDCILVWDRQYNYLYANQAAIDHVGTTHDKVIGKNIRDGLGHVPDFMHLWMARVDRAFATGESFRVEDAVSLGNRLVHSESQISPIRDAEGRVFAVGVVYRDITERKRAEDALREAHERAIWLARFPDENPNPVMRVSSDGTILYCNPATREYPGWSCEIGQPLQNELVPLLGQAMAGGRELQWDLQIEGRVYFVWIAPFPEEGYANIYGRDITERKQAEEALRESEERLNRAQEIAHLGSWELDPVNNRLTWSDEVYRIFGLQPQEFGATYEVFLEAVHPDDRAVVDAAYSGSVREGRDNYEIEHRVVRKSTGEIRVVHERCEHIRDESGQIIRSIGMVHDITERKRIEEELRQSEEKSRLLIKYAPSMFYEIDFRRLVFKSVNDLMCEFLGYTREELLAMSPFDLLDEEGKTLFRERIRRKLAGEDVSDSVEYKSRTKDGREVYGVLNITFTYRDGKPEGAVVVAHDITERKRAEEGLKQRSSELQKLAETLEQRVRERTEELEEANKGLRQLSIRLLSAHEEERKRVAGEIHDSMGSCLSGIKFKVESALEEIAETPKAATQSLNSIVPVIQEAIEECRRIQMDLRPSMLDDLGLFPTLSWFFRRFQTIYSTIHIEQKMTIEESELPDALKIVIYRVIQEAMNNAAKHSKADLVRISLRKVDNKMELFVADNGCGFSVQQRLFMDNSRRGLGLTSMRERTELSGGSFAVESVEGKGTMIRASWPI